MKVQVQRNKLGQYIITAQDCGWYMAAAGEQPYAEIAGSDEPAFVMGETILFPSHAMEMDRDEFLARVRASEEADRLAIDASAASQRERVAHMAQID